MSETRTGRSPPSPSEMGKPPSISSRMRLAAKRICYQTAWSNAMNGISSTTQIVSITPWWQSALYTADTVFIALFAIGLVWTAIALYQERKIRTKGKSVK